MATDEGMYRDKRITADADGIIVRGYYFPTGTAKHIPYQAIRSLHRYPMTWASGRARGWGATNPRYFFHLDMDRRRKTVAFVLDLGRRVHPVLTPDDPDRFEAAVRARDFDVRYHADARDIAKGLG